MVEDDKYSDKEFDSKHEMYLYWGENHRDELSSHDLEKVKKAERKEEDRKRERREDRKSLVIKGSVALGVLVLAVLAGPAVMDMVQSSGEVDTSNMEERLNLDERPVLGNRSADITVVEFGDYLCPHCADFDRTVKPQLMNYIENGDVKFYYAHLNLPAFSPENAVASEAAECVGEQDGDAFWDFHSALFRNQNALEYSHDGMLSLANETAGDSLNLSEMEACLDEGRTEQRIDEDNSYGSEIGVTSTPTIFVNGEMVDRRQSSVVEEVESRLE